MTALRFIKMHGLGNDFAIINNLNLRINAKNLPIKSLADRRFGIGFDQLLLLEPSQHANYRCQIYNADGSEAEQCGNGLRCVARLIYEEIEAKGFFTLETKAGIFLINIPNFDNISVCLHPPVLETQQKMVFGNSNVVVHKLNMGNPHAIIQVNDLDNQDFLLVVNQLAKHPLFPQGVNVGFMKIENPHHIYLRTFERGVGETFACGSNACAAAVTGILQNWLESPITVQFKKGNLRVEWAKPEEDLKLSGPATRVYTGEYILKPDSFS